MSAARGWALMRRSRGVFGSSPAHFARLCKRLRRLSATPGPLPGGSRVNDRHTVRAAWYDLVYDCKNASPAFQDGFPVCSSSGSTDTGLGGPFSRPLCHPVGGAKVQVMFDVGHRTPPVFRMRVCTGERCTRLRWTGAIFSRRHGCRSSRTQSTRSCDLSRRRSRCVVRRARGVPALTSRGHAGRCCKMLPMTLWRMSPHLRASWLLTARARRLRRGTSKWPSVCRRRAPPPARLSPST